MAHVRVNVIKKNGRLWDYVQDVIVTVRGDDGKTYPRNYGEQQGALTMYDIPYGDYKIEVLKNGQFVEQRVTVAAPVETRGFQSYKFDYSRRSERRAGFNFHSILKSLEGSLTIRSSGFAPGGRASDLSRE